jgi:hypothetical protein
VRTLNIKRCLLDWLEWGHDYQCCEGRGRLTDTAHLFLHCIQLMEPRLAGPWVRPSVNNKTKSFSRYNTGKWTLSAPYIDLQRLFCRCQVEHYTCKLLYRGLNLHIVAYCIFCKWYLAWCVGCWQSRQVSAKTHTLDDWSSNILWLKRERESSNTMTLVIKRKK